MKGIKNKGKRRDRRKIKKKKENSLSYQGFFVLFCFPMLSNLKIFQLKEIFLPCSSSGKNTHCYQKLILISSFEIQVKLCYLDKTYKPGTLSVQLKATQSTEEGENYSSYLGRKNVRFVSLQQQTFPSVTMLISSFILCLDLQRCIVLLKEKMLEHRNMIFRLVTTDSVLLCFSVLKKRKAV